MFKPVKLVTLLLSAALFVACSDDDDGDKSIVPDEQLPTEFSELTDEQNKEKLEENGLELVQDIRQLKNTQGVKTSISFSYFLSSAELPETGRTAGSLQPLDLIRSLAAFGEGNVSVTDVLKSARGKETDPEDEDPDTAQELFDSNVGVFTYDAELETWSHTPGNNGKIVFRFPSTKEGTQNDAEFVIDGYTSQQVNNPEVEYNGDLPTALKASLKVNGTEHIGYALAASYKANGEPTSIETSLTINAFKFSVKVTNTTQEVAAEYTLVHGDKTLISLGAGASGNFDSSNINDNYDEDFGTVLQRAEAFFQIVNIRFSAELNAQGLDNALQAAETIEQEADAWNANVTMVVYYADSRKKIADTEFYGTTETHEYQQCIDLNADETYGPGECNTVSFEEEAMELRLVFKDNSTSDLETYTDVGFEDIRSEIEDIFDELETDFE